MPKFSAFSILLVPLDLEQLPIPGKMLLEPMEVKNSLHILWKFHFFNINVRVTLFSANHSKPQQTTANHSKPQQTTANHSKPQQTTANYSKLQSKLQQTTANPKNINFLNFISLMFVFLKGFLLI